MKRPAFSLTSLIFILAFLVLLFGAFLFAASRMGSSRDQTFKAVSPTPTAPTEIKAPPTPPRPIPEPKVIKEKNGF